MARETKAKTKEKPHTFKMWAQLGTGLSGAYLVQVSKYRPDQDAGRSIMFPWVRATLTVESPPRQRKA